MGIADSIFIYSKAGQSKGMNLRASSGLKKRCKHRGTEFTSSSQPINPCLRVRGVRRPKVYYDDRWPKLSLTSEALAKEVAKAD
jgi:hypothetical protein